MSTHEHIDDDPPGRSSVGDALWNQLIRRNDQIFMVLNGHYHSAGGMNDGEYHQISANVANRTVFEVLKDYQDYPNGGDGWLRLINFDIPNNRIAFETYSPVLDQFQPETVGDVGQFASQFELAIDFPSRLVPVNIPRPSFVFQNGVNSYAGTRDKELRSSGGDGSNGQATTISVDGDDDGAAGLQPNHALTAFDDIVGTGPGQIAPGTEIEQALLVLEVNNAGSGFTVHEMLVNWGENSTWQDLGNGVQPDGVEAVATPIASLGANDGNLNVPIGILEIDVSTTVQAYIDGTLTNNGWALLPFSNGVDGTDFLSSESADVAFRPSLQIFVPEPSTIGRMILAAVMLLSCGKPRRCMGLPR